MNTATRARSVTELRNLHTGEDVWVVASGPSMAFYDRAFFADRVVVGVNDVWRDFPVTYAIRKEHWGLTEILDAGIPLVISEGEMGGDTPLPELDGNHWVFQHRYNQSDGPIDLDVIGTDLLVVSWSTITSAIHLAAFMGARSMIVAGHDCGLIDGNANYSAYVNATSDEWYERWVGLIEEQTMQVARRVTDVYGCPVVGLNPWPSLALNGHIHSRRG